jgi:transposase
MEDWVTIRNLKKRNPALGTRTIAGLIGISRNTVKAALKNNQEPQYERKECVNDDIKPYEDYIFEALTNTRLLKSRVLEDIKSKGYKGSKSAFYRHCEKIKQTGAQTFKPYETAPACQAQFDWSPYSVVIGSMLTKVYVYSYIHGFSRWRIYESSLSETQGSVFEALENSFIESGGICERVQTDNAKCFVTNASKENFVWNRRYLAFCGHYGFQPSRSLPGHPWSKGKVERPFNFLEEHFIKGNEFESFEDFTTRLKDFQCRVNTRVHSTTRAKPVDLFEAETPLLLRLPPTRYVGIKEEVRKATADCLVSFNGNRYSIPYLFATHEVWVKISKGYFIEIYSSQNKLIARHKLSTEKGKVIMLREHYKDHNIERGNWQRLSTLFADMFPANKWMLEKIKTQKRINPNYHLTRIIDMARYYKKEDIEKAFETCREFNIYNAMFIKGILENNSSCFDIEPVAIETLNKIKIEAIDTKRPLDYYNIQGYINGTK